VGCIFNSGVVIVTHEIACIFFSVIIFCLYFFSIGLIDPHGIKDLSSMV
jgi:hypothetical protein